MPEVTKPQAPPPGITPLPPTTAPLTREAAPLPPPPTMPPDAKLLKFEDITQSSDIRYEEVYVPEWGGKVRLRSLAANDVLMLNGSDGSSKTTGAVRTLAAALVDDKGNRLFSEENILRLAEKNMRVVNELSRRAIRLNDVTEEAVERAKKDSSGTEPDASPSA